MVAVLTVAATASAPSLVLRPWRNEDVAVLARMGADPALLRWTTFPAGDAEEIRRWVTAQHDGREAGDRISFAVQEVDPRGVPAGHVVLKLRHDAGQPVGEVGYWTAAYARGRDIAARALGEVCRWAFERYAPDRLTRLELIHQVDNRASCRVAAKAQFSRFEVIPPRPPWPLEGHLHVRSRHGEASLRSQDVVAVP
ncbi:GNAT family N-acetyltransferase [Amorphoplanes digitatis]|uniref:RimJ/RimL family protein N-acetyltransferase n=1 Tax=Actinoplanes digitatis TaxID=1868 RepID=A0A7W7MQW9_9ACTN|nr:GNAT family N-acetyltransferase [Actinoplanes digitatis]MBB4762995.1 RimJ/RimL family protein N-acetyltransferase [Actinoplanes digitatis]GID95804.1 acetyltransferase [Actinoplanes digitatis]